MQALLLRVLQENEVHRIGGESVIPIDVRIIVASNKCLVDEVQKGRFREDLFYRLNILSLSIPDLSQRVEDIPLLVRHFIKKFSIKYNKSSLVVNEEEMDHLIHRNYVGNIRELENLIECASILGSLSLAEKELLPCTGRILCNKQMMQKKTLSDIEHEYIMMVYNESNKDFNKTMKILGISKSTLWRKLKEFQIN